MLKKSRGIATLELAVVLPVLLLLAFGVFEYVRAIHANNIVVNMSREGANLATRTQQFPQDIMQALATTADPLDIGTQGMIYITVVVGREGDPIVLEQHKWLAIGGGYDATSRAWGDCTDWADDGTCNLPETPPVADTVGMDLDEGETVYAVEVFYNHQPIITYVMMDAIELYSLTVF